MGGGLTGADHSRKKDDFKRFEVFMAMSAEYHNGYKAKRNKALA
jgi:hypothetical protein